MNLDPGAGPRDARLASGRLPADSAGRHRCNNRERDGERSEGSPETHAVSLRAGSHAGHIRSSLGSQHVDRANVRGLSASIGPDAQRYPIRGPPSALPKRCGVVAIPTGVFYDDTDAAPTLVRFAFCKHDELIAEAARRLASLRGG
jgi:hypothetical protein